MSEIPPTNTANGPDNATYQIGTLRDIFALPSYQHMERCLNELTLVLLQTRATADLFIAVSGIEKTPPPDLKFLFPEALPWIDDGKRNIDASFVDANGAVLFKARTRKTADLERESR